MAIPPWVFAPPVMYFVYRVITSAYRSFESSRSRPPQPVLPVSPAAIGRATSLTFEQPEPLTADFVGDRYVLGHTATQYAIRERKTTTAVSIQTYPLTDEGWLRAWDAFLVLEPDPQPKT